MVDTSNQMKLLISAFMVLLLGAVLIRPIANDIDQVNTPSYDATNETLAFADSTTIVLNESYTNIILPTIGVNFTVANDDLASVQEIRNSSATVINCNVTLRAGFLSCNETNSTAIFVDYTWISGKTVTLANDDVLTLTALRNVTSESIIGECNATFSTGALVCNNTHNGTGFADYTYESTTGFIRSSTTRTLLTLVTLFFAITVLAIGIGFAVKSFKEGGLM